MLWGSHIKIWNIANHMNKNETKNMRPLVFRFSPRFSIFMFFVLFFHVVCKTSNFDVWTAKHLGQASCNELTLWCRITSFLSLLHLSIWTRVGTKGWKQIIWLKYGKNFDVDYCWSFLSWGAVISKTLLNLPRLLTYFALGHLHTYLLHTYCIQLL